MSEFDLIRRHFSAVGSRRTDVSLGVGDDCALLRVPQGQELAVSIDTLVAGVHFLPDCDPEGLGHKALAVGLSDLAAMGAEPAWVTLALTLPDADEGWLRAFSRGFARLAHRHGVALVGGDLTRGPLSVTAQVQGLVPEAAAMRRRGARPGDLICVSGTLGDAGLALRRLGAGESISEYLRDRLERPTPRVELGLALRGAATAMIDLSDGLAADLGHLLAASEVGAEIRLPDLPLSPEIRDRLATDADWDLPLASGDDYELCFCVPEQARARMGTLAERLGIGLRVIGRIRPGKGLRCLLENGSTWEPPRAGYNHFPDAG
ncbi:MAG: thiamine-phosphate kinase [Candidatus Thiosymbion ectosymbiont of Robbea hypermnestra]|nr:thiamine-phosphate kinase [Candidatus Thiosymbion ectosymbiont of Robbea hypermnestra]